MMMEPMLVAEIAELVVDKRTGSQVQQQEDLMVYTRMALVPKCLMEPKIEKNTLNFIFIETYYVVYLGPDII